MTLEASERDFDDDVLAGSDDRAQALGDSPRVALLARQRFAESLGGGHDIIKRTEPPQIEIKSNMKAEEIIFERVGDNVEKNALATSTDASLGPFEICGQTG